MNSVPSAEKSGRPEGLTISQGTRAVSDSFYMMKRARLLELSPDQRATFRRRVIDFNLPALDNSQAVLSPLSAERHQSSDHVSQFYFSRVNPTFSVT